ncbi:MAG: response regulator [Gammaproteobacteria bacterium]|nr:response regulator [Gammaproteobacteria bacterium]MBL4729101.1 response regulator [Gammaproteobacteria bacterium]
MDSYSVSQQFRKLLVVDDNKDITDLIEELARIAGYDVVSVNDFKELKDAYRKFEPDLIFLDLDLGLDKDIDMSEKGYDGLAVFNFLSGIESRSKIVLISGMGKEKVEITKTIGKEMNLNVVGSFSKPFSIDRIDQFLLKLRR